jgi:UMF1 family MFS transporter
MHAPGTRDDARVTDVEVLEADPAERRRERRGWYFYDWANSAYATTVVAVFYGPYLTSVAKAAAGCGADEDPCTRSVLSLLGVHLGAGSFYSYVLALSVVVQVVVLPVTGAIADRSRRKREILAAFAFTGSGATALMWFVQGDRFLLGGLLYLVANMAFGASIVVYNSFLPEIAAPDERDKASARGWALGYLGGGLLLLLNLVLYASYKSLGLTEGQAVRISLLSAGIWWAGFTLIPLSRLRDRGPAAPEHGPGVVRAGFGQLRRTLAEVRRYPVTLRFLVAYLVFNDGIQSTIGLAALYGDQQLGLGQSTLIAAILLVQFVAFVGALGLGRIARRFGAQRTILGSLVVWTVVVALAYLLQPGHALQFYALAAAIGVVLGGSQALSRSLYSQLIPPGKEAEYFSLYEISERGTSWMGALLFGVTYQLTGSYRNALVSIIVFFVLGFLLLARVRVREGIAAAGNEQPELV